MPENPSGRDFVVGDIHGHFELLLALLERVRFEPSHDRVISVGDMVDRGPDSLGVIKLARNPWFFSVRGNHEHYHAKGMLWPHLGIEWFLSLSENDAVEVRAFFGSLPHVIVVPGEHRYHVVHGQLSARYVESEAGVFLDADIDADWYGFPSWILPGSGAVYDIEAEFLEGRTLASRVAAAMAFGATRVEPIRIPGLSTTYCGHTRLPTVGYSMSHVFIDTGVDRGGALTMIEHATGEIWAVGRDAKVVGVSGARV